MGGMRGMDGVDGADGVDRGRTGVGPMTRTARSRRAGSGSRFRARVLAVLGVAAAAVVVVVPVGAAHAATAVVAWYHLDEGPGAVTMHDSGGFGLDGHIGPAVQTGATFAGSTGYRWSKVSPTAPPAKPERIVSVPTNPLLNPDSGDYTVEFRYRTSRSFGNVLQKGQNKTTGGYWKFEQPSGHMTCLYKGGNGQQRAIVSPVTTNDGNWYSIRCERTPTEIRLIIDGVRVGRLVGPTGNIANNQPLSIGGKSACDQITVTCDYFEGDIDDIRIEKAGVVAPANQAPVASFTSSCFGLGCTFDGSASSDSDGSIVARAWDFGDGTSATGVTATHAYGAPGTYAVRLTVFDDDGATAVADRTVTVADVTSGIEFVGGATRSSTGSTVTVTTPGVVAGDALVLFVSAGSPVTMGEPAGVGGWVPLDSVGDSRGVTRAWWKVATAADGGAGVTVTMSGAAKASIGVVAYGGTSPTAPIATFARTLHSDTSAVRTTPQVAVSGGEWVTSYWMHRDSSSTSLAAPGGVATRIVDTQSGGGHPTVLIADSAGPVPGGQAGGLSAAAQANSSFGTSWTLVLRPG